MKTMNLRYTDVAALVAYGPSQVANWLLGQGEYGRLEHSTVMGAMDIIERQAEERKAYAADSLRKREEAGMFGRNAKQATPISEDPNGEL